MLISFSKTAFLSYCWTTPWPSQIAKTEIWPPSFLFFLPLSKSSPSSNPAAIIQMLVVMTMGPKRPHLERGSPSPLLGKQVEALCSSCLSPPGALSNGICKLPYGFFHLSSLLWAALNPGLKFFKGHYNVSTWAGSDILRLMVRKKVGPPRARSGSVEISAPCVLQESQVSSAVPDSSGGWPRVFEW